MIFSTQFINSWKSKPLIEQLANIGSEVHRALSWKSKNDLKLSKTFYKISLELIDLTLKSKLTPLQLIEIKRLKKDWINYYDLGIKNNLTDEYWEKYFYLVTLQYAIKRHPK